MSEAYDVAPVPTYWAVTNDVVHGQILVRLDLFHAAGHNTFFFDPLGAKELSARLDRTACASAQCDSEGT